MNEEKRKSRQLFLQYRSRQFLKSQRKKFSIVEMSGKLCRRNLSQFQVYSNVRVFVWTYTVRLLSFSTGIIKSICTKEMTLLLFSFRRTSLLSAHTDLCGHTASGCLCRSRSLSRLSGCPKKSQRDAPSSAISLLGTKSNQQVLNLANTEGGRAQSLFTWPKTA